jgi:hypothetical protein
MSSKKYHRRHAGVFQKCVTDKMSPSGGIGRLSGVSSGVASVAASVVASVVASGVASGAAIGDVASGDDFDDPFSGYSSTSCQVFDLNMKVVLQGALDEFVKSTSQVVGKNSLIDSRLKTQIRHAETTPMHLPKSVLTCP